MLRCSVSFGDPEASITCQSMASIAIVSCFSATSRVASDALRAYACEIAGRTEQYWCPIKHARRVIAAHEGYDRFAEFGDADAFRKRTEKPSTVA
ncbi:hypothetical protein [uncultured Bradyrhizobium sp.]|uniref:hypothetical protein n=1 Tax=uncultured Bradyrhizobium sp. TaxID=199684 RepID=UPI0035CBC1A4